MRKTVIEEAEKDGARWVLAPGCVSFEENSSYPLCSSLEGFENAFDLLILGKIKDLRRISETEIEGDIELKPEYNWIDIDDFKLTFEASNLVGRVSNEDLPKVVESCRLRGFYLHPTPAAYVPVKEENDENVAD